MADRLAALLGHFAVRAHTFQTGALCGIHSVDAEEPFGQLHLIRDGEVEVRHGTRRALRIKEPSLLLYPRPLGHRFVTDTECGAHFVCANVAFEGGINHPIAAALPPVVCMPLAKVPSCESVLALLFTEAASSNCGRQAMLDRLFEVLIIQILRELMEQGQLESGMLAGMAHARLRLALVAMHETPQRDWSLEDLAKQASMSRTVFANSFRDVVGCPPGVYLLRWRMCLAQKRLRQGHTLKQIGSEIGYSSEAALSRAFRAQTGLSPREWLKADVAASE